MTLRLILLGAPGAGKGTQAEKLSAEKKLAHISTGNILRQAISEGSELGLKAKSFMDAGELVPDEVIVGLIHELFLGMSEDEGFVLDGFPRTEAQAIALDAMLLEMGRPITHVLEIQVPENEVLKRIQKRGADSGRSDDCEDVARNRLDVYKKQTLPVTEHYSAKNLVVGVDGEGSVDEVFSRIVSKLEA